MRHLHKAREGYEKGRLLRVIQCLKVPQHASAVELCERQPVDLGFLQPLGSFGASAKPECTRGSQAGGPSLASTPCAESTEVMEEEEKEEEQSLGIDASLHSGFSAESWDKNNTKIGMVGQSLLVRALREAEPAIFNDGNLSRLLRRGQRAYNGPRLLQHLELMTTMDALTFIPKEQRCHAAFCTWVCGINVQLGRRCRDLVIVRDDDEQFAQPHGVYKANPHAKKKGVLIVEHNFIPKSAKEVAAPKDFVDYFIDCNYSEKGAVLRSHTHVFQKTLVALFEDLPMVSSTREKHADGKVKRESTLAAQGAKPRTPAAKEDDSAAPPVAAAAAEDLDVDAGDVASASPPKRVKIEPVTATKSPAEAQRSFKMQTRRRA